MSDDESILFRFGALPFIIVGALGVFGIAYGGFAMHAYFSPKYEEVRRETFEKSKAYNQGMAQELQNMQFQYAQADTEHKAALRAIILHRAADYDTSKLPPDTAAFIQQLKNEATR